jgi:hydroxypyruvate isomerase
MFDTYHMGMSEPDLLAAYARSHDHVGHIQIASVPARAEPDTGTINILAFLEAARHLGYDADVGVEFRPAGSEPRLDWLAGWRARLEA